MYAPAVGSDAFKQAVDRELTFFEDELRVDLIRIAAADNATLYQPQLVAKGITRLVFAMGATAMDLPAERREGEQVAEPDASQDEADCKTDRRGHGRFTP